MEKPAGVVGLTNNASGQVVRNIFARRRALRALQEVPALRDLAAHVLAHPVFKEPDDEAHVKQDSFNDLWTRLGRLELAMQLLETSIACAIPDEHPRTIAVEVTELKTMKEMATLFTELDVIIEQITSVSLIPDEDAKRALSEGIKEPVIQTFDAGSSWIEIVIPTVTAFSVLGASIRAAVDIAREVIRMSAEYRDLRVLGLREDEIQSRVDFNKKVRAAMARKAAEKLADGTWTRKDNEDVNRLAGVLQKETKLIMSGVRFSPGFKTDAAIRKSFPSFHDLQLPAVDRAARLTAGDDLELPPEPDSGDQ